VQSCDTLIENIIKECFGLEIKVEFKDFEIDEDKINEYIEFKENEEAKIVTDTVIKNNEKTQKTEKVKKRPGNQKQCIFGRWGKVRGYFWQEL